ncbi:MAG TPA: STAS domain-containing protein [Thermoanaerobaculia bacterium]|nr:STAS domain-containing protein [Thermoanaerobaculia bacterium]
MEFVLHTHDEVTVVRLAGRLDGTGSATFERDVEPRLAEGALRVVLDLAELEYLASAGLRVLFKLAKRSAAARGGLWLCSARPAVRTVLDVAGVSRIIPLLETEAEALSVARG